MKHLVRTFVVIALFAGCAGQEPRTWQTVDAGPFTFQAPASLRRVPSRGLDSYVAEFRDRNIHLTFDYGAYSNNLADWPSSSSFETTVIDGRHARIGKVTHDFGHRFPYATAVSIRDVYPPASPDAFRTHLTMFAYCRTPADRLVAQRIFRSLRFNPKL